MCKRSVAVIGAGAAGLCAAKHVFASEKYKCTIFEQTGYVGGTWVYTDDVHNDKYGSPIHSSMYKLLKTNLAKEIMQFPDFPFPKNAESFLHHTEVCHYLETYAEHHQLYQHIQFFKKVDKVQPINEGGSLKWRVRVIDLPSGEMKEHIFDYVMVCNGHYSQPKVPCIPGIENFKGLIFHSHEYRTSDPFKGKKVVLQGASSSGVDISIEISNVAEEVFLCHRLPHKMKLSFPANVKQSPNVVSAFDGGFILEDGSKVEVDAFLYCTGYQYNFPFLSEDCKIQVIENCVLPLYKHLINIEYPSMCLVGIPFTVVPFVMFDYQVQFFLKTLDNSLLLPPKEVMEQDTKEDLQKRLGLGMPARHAHKLDSLQWEYFDCLAVGAKISKLPLVHRKIYEDTRISTMNDVVNFKKHRKGTLMEFEIADNAALAHLWDGHRCEEPSDSSRQCGKT